MNKRSFLLGIFGTAVAGVQNVEVSRRLTKLKVYQSSVAELSNARRYYHGSNWTVEEIAVLARRGQPVINYRGVRIA